MVPLAQGSRLRHDAAAHGFWHWRRRHQEAARLACLGKPGSLAEQTVDDFPIAPHSAAAQRQCDRPSRRDSEAKLHIGARIRALKLDLRGGGVDHEALEPARMTIAAVPYPFRHALYPGERYTEALCRADAFDSAIRVRGLDQCVASETDRLVKPAGIGEQRPQRLGRGGEMPLPATLDDWHPMPFG